MIRDGSPKKVQNYYLAYFGKLSLSYVLTKKMWVLYLDWGLTSYWSPSTFLEKINCTLCLAFTSCNLSEWTWCGTLFGAPFLGHVFLHFFRTHFLHLFGTLFLANCVCHLPAAICQRRSGVEKGDTSSCRRYRNSQKEIKKCIFWENTISSVDTLSWWEHTIFITVLSRYIIVIHITMYLLRAIFMIVK